MTDAEFLDDMERRCAAADAIGETTITFSSAETNRAEELANRYTSIGMLKNTVTPSSRIATITSIRRGMTNAMRKKLTS
jgi:hypothetical protein